MKWYEKIRERRVELGLSQAELAKKVRMSQASIDKIERGLVQRPRALPDLCAALDLDPNELRSDGGAPNFFQLIDIDPDEPLGLGRRRRRPSGSQDVPPADTFPVYSAGAQLMAFPAPLDTAIQFLPIPQVPSLPIDGYGLMVVDDDMFPAYEAGEIALVNPRLPVIRGTDAVLYVKGDQGHLEIILGRVGRYDLGRGDDTYSLEQWNLNGEKPGTIVSQIPRKDVVAAHRVVGKLFR
ncbi:MAG: helix-turn-helix transcriptional regulator [Chelatococcus sp.]|uniref:helix-turn-helix domain-containing protein n=1 Tax=Chelatococcus sp. TaxID=1953771 RepID=UPI0025C2429B|nr:helix-turn-helix transcriptional regulator [Chelatococcus sp.]MBX3537314.1 helix-turn-helix transcriptional regulator [Chelatococcus sp.]